MNLLKHGSSWRILLVIFGVAMINQCERFSNFYVVIGFVMSGSSMKEDTGITDLEYGVLTGFAFLLTYGFSQFLMGWVADNISRPKKCFLIFGFLWNFSILVTSLATSFTSLLCLRLLFGFFSSALDPLGIRMAASQISTRSRGLACGIFLGGIYWGSSLAALTLLLSQAVGWQYTHVIIGALGAVLTMGLISMLQDDRTCSSSILLREVDIKNDLRQLFKNPTVIIIPVANALRYAITFSRLAFEPKYFTSQFHEHSSDYSIIFFICSMCAPFGTILGGLIADRFEQTYPQVRPYVCVITCLVSLPFVIAQYWVESFSAAMICMFLGYIIGEAYVNNGFVIMINVTTPANRSLRNFYVEGGLNMVYSVSSATISTLLLGYFNTSDSNLKMTLTVISALGYIGGAGLFFLSSLFYPEDLKSEQMKHRENEDMAELREYK